LSVIFQEVFSEATSKPPVLLVYGNAILEVLTVSEGAPACVIVTVEKIAPSEIVRVADLAKVDGFTALVVTVIDSEVLPVVFEISIHDGIPVIVQVMFAEVISNNPALPEV